MVTSCYASDCAQQVKTAVAETIGEGVRGGEGVSGAVMLGGSLYRCSSETAV